MPPKERFQVFSDEMKRRNLDGFLIPRSDEFQGEYVSCRSERLAWLTGFTGSAGLAIVLQTKIILFVDGRYTLQAKTETDGRLCEIRHLNAEPPADWIAASFPARGRLGYDPWLHAPRDIERYEPACEKVGAALVACDDNPVDAVWPDQPPPPISPVVPHPIRYAGRPNTDKQLEVAALLRRDGVDAVVVTAPDSVAWLLNLRGGDVPFSPLPLSFAIVHADGGVDLFIDRRKLIPGIETHLGKTVRIADMKNFILTLEELGAGGKTIRINPAKVPQRAFACLKQAGATLSRGENPCALSQAVKNETELKGIRAAHRRDGAALCRFFAWLSEKGPAGELSEITAAARIDALRREDDLFQGCSFPTISGAGPNGAVVHYRATEQTDRKLETGSLYLVDSGGQYLDATTDVTRTIAIGTPSAEMRDRFTRVLKGHIAIASARFPAGTKGAQLDSLARLALWDAGLDYDHGTGHGVGCYLNVHEGPQGISKTAGSAPLMPGMVVSNEPGYYKAGAYGIRIENLLAVISGPQPQGAEKDVFGFEVLTLAPIDLALVKADMLNSSEKAWLNDYHGRVRDTISPLVDEKTAAWLKTATEPLSK
ncbi:MAG: aminopeptidase P family protein [Rhodospirillales bacterium]|nr:aminopeptidase P family protein [Rhodospirillales bacterium]